MARGDIPQASGHKPNNAVVPALVNPPVIFIAPAARTVSSGEIWMAVSCDDVNYGGCIIYASNDDGESYHRIGYLRGSSTHGVLTAPLPSATGLDTTHTLAIDVLASGGVIESPGQVSLDTHDALCFAGGEFLAFKTATPTALGFYDLTHLERGLYGSEAGSGTGAPFVMCDDKLFRYPFNANLVGHTIWLKFQGANGGQKGLQDIAELVAYPFVVSGDGGRKALQSDLEPIIASVDQKLDIIDIHRNLTVLDENANTVAINLVNNALPVLDENGDEFFIELTSVENITRNDGGASEVMSYSDLNLYATSSKVQSIVMTAPEYNVFLPNATLLSRGGPKFVIKNNGTYTFVVKDFNGTSLAALGSGKIASFFLAENSTSAGHWLSGNDNITAFSNTLSPGAEVQLKTHMTSVTKTVLLSANLALMLFKEGGNTLKAYLIFISGDEITTGDILTITTDASSVGFDLEKISSSQALVFYGSSSSNAAQAVTLNVSGSSLSAGTILAIREGVEDLTACLDLTLINATDVLATVDIVSHNTNNCYCRAYILRITGTTITAGNSLDIEFSSGSPAATKSMLQEVSVGKFVLLYAKDTPFIRCCVLEVTDLSLSKGANLTVASTSAQIGTADIICLSPTRILVTYAITTITRFDLVGISGAVLTKLNSKTFYLDAAHRVKLVKLSTSKILALFSRTTLLYAVYSVVDDVGYTSDTAPIFASGFSNFSGDNDYPVALRISDSELLCSASNGTSGSGGDKSQHCILNIAADFPYINPITFANNYLTTESIKSFFLDAERFLIIGVSNSNYSKAFVLTKI